MTGILIILFKTPLQKLLIMALDRVKFGKAPGVVKSVAATTFVIMMYTVYTIHDIQSRPIDALNPTDHVLLVNHMLEASLMGILLFLSMVIGRLHQFVREQDSVEADIKAEEVSLAWKRHQLAVQLSTLKREKLKLETKIKSLECECGTMANKAASATDAVLSLKMQSEGFQLEYMRTLEYNQSLWNQLQSIDYRLVMEDQKTRWTHLISSIVQWTNQRADAVTAVEDDRAVVCGGYGRNNGDLDTAVQDAAPEAAHRGAGPLKRGKAPIVVKSVVATLFVIMMYTVYTIRDIQCHLIVTLNSTDHVLLANHTLQASLIEITVPNFNYFYEIQAAIWGYLPESVFMRPGNS
ncbi:hypothetical protein RJ639_006299 [Escallonia herrerae]|uniref:Endoplasmic reticulum transmembrane protein n=1 Tax=Escallonia herrerae TaxID=1293975 RepID=A0AA88VYJ1_9ASTE|nr:hypothetical protein RJ639_006299 [Escallonia herrerae]